LHANPIIITVKRSNISVVNARGHGDSGRTGHTLHTPGYGSNSTPAYHGGARTPAYGSTTPRADGSRTPSYGQDGSRTPQYQDGGRTPQVRKYKILNHIQISRLRIFKQFLLKYGNFLKRNEGLKKLIFRPLEYSKSSISMLPQKNFCYLTPLKIC
jgi:hypothetical protein